MVWVFVYKWQEKMYVVSDCLKKCFTCFELLEISKCSSQNLCLTQCGFQQNKELKKSPLPTCFLVVTTPFLLHSCKPKQELSGSHLCNGSALAVSLPTVHCFSVMSCLSFCRLYTSFSFVSELHKHLCNVKLQPNLFSCFAISRFS